MRYGLILLKVKLIIKLLYSKNNFVPASAFFAIYQLI